MQKKSMTVCAMCEIYLKYILKWGRKRTGMKPETASLRISIVGTEVFISTENDVLM